MRNLLALTLLALLAPLALAAQDGVDIGGREEKAAWRADLFLDELGYDPDYGMGVAAGVAVRHGLASDRRDNRHLFDLRAAYHSEEMSELHFKYDTRHLLPWGMHLTVGAHYEADPMAGFHGFGGASSPYYRELDRRGGVAFYGIRRDVARAAVDIGGNIVNLPGGRGATQLGWSVGASLTDYKIGSVTRKKYADGADNSLYNLYRKYGLVSEAEAAGGRRIEFSGGFISNGTYAGSRTMHIIRAEVGVRVSPDLFDRRADYAKLGARFTHTTLIVPALVTLEYRLGYDGTVWSQGPVPFYVQSERVAPLGEMPEQGLGGKGTLRGVLAERVVGDGVAWGGVDVAVQAAQFRLLRKNWFVSPVVFMDAGAVVQPFRLDEMRDVWNNTRLPAAERRLIYSGVDEKIHASAGLGVTVHNAAGWSVYALWGKSFARQDGPGAVYAGVKWQF